MGAARQDLLRPDAETVARLTGEAPQDRVGHLARLLQAEVFQQRLRYFLKMTAQNKRFGMVQ
jgi:hypothetical protein